MKKKLKLGLFFIFLTILTACSTNQFRKHKNISMNDYDFTIVFSGNTNGQVETTENCIGYPILSTILKNHKKEIGENKVIYLDGGNNFYGSDFSKNDKGKSIVKILNALELTATTLGSNSFDYGIRNLSALEMRSNFKIISSNLKERNGNDFTIPFIIEEINGKKIGIFALVNKENFKNIPNNLIIENPIINAKKTVKELKKLNVDYIVAITNLEINQKNENQNLISLAKSTPNIDLILDGNSIHAIEQKIIINNTPIIQVGKNFENIGIIKIDLDAKKSNPQKVNYKLIKRNEISTYKNYKEKTSQLNQEIITHTVKKGDTLYSLAKKYNTTVENIITANPNLKDNIINIGQTYNITQKTNLIDEKAKEYIKHTVKKGDTLYSLAKKYNTTVENIITANPNLKDNIINIGQTYNITQKTNLIDEKAKEYISHTVKKGDTLYSLAKKYNITVKKLISLNPEIKKDKKIKTGFLYKIPNILKKNITNNFNESANKNSSYNNKSFNDAEFPYKNENKIKIDLNIENIIFNTKNRK